MKRELGWEDILGEIKLLRQAEKGWIYIVEGVTDSEVLEYIFERDPSVIVVAESKEHVEKLAGALKDEKCIYLVDKDLEIADTADPIINTDYYDIENFLIRSAKIKHIIARFCSGEKCAQIDVVSAVDDVAEWVPRLRFALQQLGLSFKFTHAIIADVTRTNQPYFDSERLKNRMQVGGLSEDQTAAVFDAAAQVTFVGGREKYISSKAWLVVFGKFCRHRFGNLSAGQTDFDHMHAIAMTALDRSCFNDTAWLARIQAKDGSFV